MERPSLSPGAEPAPLVVTTDRGQATFRRFTPATATLDVEYHTPGLCVRLDGATLPDAVDGLLEAEIALMRQTLGALGNALAARLPRAGSDPFIRRDWRNAERRDWHHDGSAFRVLPTATRLSDRLDGYEGASDALLVGRSVTLLIAQREENLRDVYRRVLVEARAKGAHEGNEGGIVQPGVSAGGG